MILKQYLKRFFTAMLNESYAKIPAEIIKSKKITNLEFRVLSVLILLSSYNSGHTFFGSFKLSDMCGIGRVALRKALNRLKELKFVEITPRGSFSRSNDIYLTLSAGVEFLRLGGDQKNSIGSCQVDLKDSPDMDLKDSPEVDLNDSRVDLNDSPIKKIDLNNLNLNKNNTVDLNDSPAKKENKREESESADVAADRSMPCGEQVAAKNSAKEECAGACADKIQALLPVLDDYFGDLRPWIQVFEVNNKIGIRVLGRPSKGYLKTVQEFAERNCLLFSQHNFTNERIIAA